MLVLIVGAALFGVAGAAFSVVHASIRRGLPRNSSLGIKTRATLASDEAWRAGHDAARPWLRSSALTAYTASVVCGAVALISQSPSEGVVALVMLSGFAALITVLICAGVIAERAARSASTPSP